MIRPKRRTIDEILTDRSGRPWTAAEERRVDRHIRRECDKIRSGWTDEIAESRRLGITLEDLRALVPWVPPIFPDRED